MRRVSRPRRLAGLFISLLAGVSTPGLAEELAPRRRRRVPAALGAGPAGRRGARHARPAAPRAGQGPARSGDRLDRRGRRRPRDPGGARRALPGRGPHQSREPRQGDARARPGGPGAERLAGLPRQGPQRGGGHRRARRREPERRAGLQAVDEQPRAEAERPRLGDPPALDGPGDVRRPAAESDRSRGWPSSIACSRSTAATPAAARRRSASTSARGRRTWASGATWTSSSRASRPWP